MSEKIEEDVYAYDLGEDNKAVVLFYVPPGNYPLRGPINFAGNPVRDVLMPILRARGMDHLVDEARCREVAAICDQLVLGRDQFDRLVTVIRDHRTLGSEAIARAVVEAMGWSVEPGDA